ncbi:MAG: hypothetical protein IJL88_11370 [Clostridia bacterium]|nr:hypothetical protein [Clostridia bacterium]
MNAIGSNILRNQAFLGSVCSGNAFRLVHKPFPLLKQYGRKRGVAADFLLLQQRLFSAPSQLSLFPSGNCSPGGGSSHGIPDGPLHVGIGRADSRLRRSSKT